MTHIIDNSTVESVLNNYSWATPPQTWALASGTRTLTNANSHLQVFTGTTAGQIVQFSDARTYPVGWRYFLINTDTATIDTRNGAGTTLIQIQPRGLVEFFLTDNSTLAGVWKMSVHSASNLQGIAPAICGYGGQANTGRYLEFVSGNASDTGPFVVIGGSYLVAISCSANASTTGAVSVYKTTDLATPIATLTITTASSGYIIFTSPAALTAGDLLAVKISSGSFNKPFVTIYFGY